MAKSKIYLFSDEEFTAIVNQSDSFAECCRALGLSDKGSNGPNMIKRRCGELGITTEHFTRKAKHSNKATYSLDEILVKNSTYTAMHRLKIRLFNAGLLEQKCSMCGNNGEWNEKPLSLTLDHINGVHSDNRLENLRILCPNCHSQTETFSGKNKKQK